MKQIALIAAIATLSGCATVRPGGVKPIGKVGRMGASFCSTESGLLVRDVNAGSAAAAAGIQEGDVIANINGLDLDKPENRKDFLFHIRSGKPATFSVKRQDKIIEVHLLPKETALYPLDPIIFSLEDEILTGEKVALVVVVTDVNHTGAHPNADALAGWKAGIKSRMETDAEAAFLGFNRASRCNNYAVIDRNKTNEILTELHFQMTGAVDTGMMKTVGKMTGATQMLFASLTRFPDHGGWKDQISYRLVDLESSNVLATASVNVDVAK